ncbi:hypothetical protein BH10CHL1_BH10CHL1_33890 [soil metagenome]
MSRLTLRLPETLHQSLEALARQEGVSLNQYIVYALAQQSAVASVLHEVPINKIAEQRASYIARLQQAQIATEEEIDQVLAEREQSEPEPELTPEIIALVKQRIAADKKKIN